MKEKVIGVGFIAIIFIFILIQDISMKAFHWNAFELFVVGVLAIMIIYGLVMSLIKPEKVKLDVNAGFNKEDNHSWDPTRNLEIDNLYHSLD